MRGVHVAILTVAGLLVGSAASAQGLGEVAAQEKQRRQAEPTQGKAYTESDLGPSIAPVALPEALPADPDKESSAEEAGDAGGEPEASSAAEERAQAEAAWRQRLDQARKEEAVYKEVVDKLQLELNDMSGGVYNPGRASKIAFLEENQQLLAAAQQNISDLEDEGRRNRYR